MERLVEGLNEPQRRAVEHGAGPMLVLAGAGSGKTRVLTHRIAHLVATGLAHPSEILAITFTNKAADEMRERVEGLVGGVSRLMWVMTFHSACARILRREAERLGYKRSFTIYDSADSQRMVKRCMDELDVDPKRFPARAVQSQISGAKNRLLDAEGYREETGGFFEDTVAGVYALYEKRMHEANAMDFDDLLVRTVNLFELFEDVRTPLPEGVPLDPRRRVPGHEPRPVPAAPAAHPGARQPDGRRRRCAVGLFLPPRGHPQHPRLRARLPRRGGREARAELPLDRGDPRGGERGDRQQPRAEAQGAVDGPRPRRAGADRRARRRARGGPLRGRGDRPPGLRGGLRALRGRGLLPDQRAEPRARGHAGALRRPLPGDRRHEVLRARRDQGRDRLPEPDRQPRGRRLLRPRRQLAPARDRQHDPGPAALVREHDREDDLGGRSSASRRCRTWARRRSSRSRASPRRWRRCASAPRRRRASPTCSRP